MLNRAMASFCAARRAAAGRGLRAAERSGAGPRGRAGGLRLGIDAVWLKSDPAGGRSPSHLDYDPIWDLLQRERVPLVLHIGGGRGLDKRLPCERPPGGDRLARRRREPARQGLPRHLPLAAELPDRADLRPGVPALSGLMCGVIELGATWVPGFLRILDQGHRAFRKAEPLLQSLALYAVGVLPPPGAGQPVSL
jgi:uncharacterized protein